MQESMEATIDGRVPWQSHRSLREQAWKHVAPALADSTRDYLASVVQRLQTWPDSATALHRLRGRCQWWLCPTPTPTNCLDHYGGRSSLGLTSRGRNRASKGLCATAGR
jgi:hypothetical protein